MITELSHELKRQILIEKKPYTLLLTAESFRLTEKGKRKGLELKWSDLVSGDVALATALQASLTPSNGKRPQKRKRPG